MAFVATSESKSSRPHTRRLSRVEVGHKLEGRYTLTKRIAASAMSEVYVAHQHSLDRDVAVKVLHPRSTAEGQLYQRRFEREIRALARVRHPNIVGLLDSGVSDGLP